MSEKEEYMKIEANWNIPFVHSAGKHASKFLTELRDNKKIIGSKCPKCNRVLIPPRPFCERCFVTIDKWQEVSDEGEIETLSINYTKYIGLPDPPYALGMVRLDGADTNLLHFLGGIDLTKVDEAKEKLKIGTRVKAVWKDKREGRLTDILYFAPIEK